ncbi:MAG TPA: DUF6159 family protein [Gemmataceae bacterium]|nr:DUF6159 family protein [Gemmataceae bacterium]
MFDRISASFGLARSSWDVLRNNKQFLLFPLLSGVGFILVVLSFVIPLGAIALAGGIPTNFDQLPDNQKIAWEVAGVVCLFAFYFLTAFVIVFCNAALVSCAIMRFNGQTPTLGDGFRAAAARWPQILGWALVSATVSVLIKAIESNKRVGQIVSSILGMVWAVITYFVLPVLVVEKMGPFKAIGRSVEILKKTWGEALVGHFTLGFFKFLAILPFILLLVVGAFLIAGGQTTPALIYVGIAVFVVAGVYFLIYATVASAMDTIFISALYQYAAFNTVPEGFDQSAMENAFRRRR